MSGAPEKRQTVRVLIAAGISTEAAACRLVGTSRSSSLPIEAKPKDDDRARSRRSARSARASPLGLQAHAPPALPPRPRREPQAHRAHLARAWPRACPAQASGARCSDRRRRAGRGRVTGTTSGPTTSSTTPSPRGARLKVLTVRRRVHARGARRARGALDHRAHRQGRARAALRAPRRARGDALGQRRRVRRLRGRRLARGERHRAPSTSRPASPGRTASASRSTAVCATSA